MQTVKENPEFPFTQDFNTGNTIGVGWSQNMIGDGKRAGAAASYLHSGAVHRTNLTVLVHAQATKLVKTGEQDGIPIFRSVEFAQTNEVTLAEPTAGDSSYVGKIEVSLNNDSQCNQTPLI
jgi:choline dehydrogenase-like flavoprotein